jgi:hypothetical protein
MDFNIPGFDRGVAVAGFSGAVAYLVVQDKLPPLRALGYVFAGGAVAVYVGPGIVEWMQFQHYISAQLPDGSMPRAGYAVVFGTGVGGIWIIHVIVAFLQALKDRSTSLVEGIIARLFGPKGGQ